MNVRFLLIMVFLFAPVSACLFGADQPSDSLTMRDYRTVLKFSFENDLITYANTDRYFTNGLSAELQAPWIRHSLLRKLMVPYRGSAAPTYAISIVQDMYTPSDTRIVPELKNDRPYSSYLYMGFRQTSANPVRRIAITSQLDAGYIGPYSPGAYLQTRIHKLFPSNEAPLGWETQINSDIILNYHLLASKAVLYSRSLVLLANLDARVGTLYDNAGAGFRLQAGRADPVFGLSAGESYPMSEYYFFASAHTTIVAYNALLQGGVFNRDNIFTLDGSQIYRLTVNAEFGIHLRYKGVSLEVAQHFLSPEFRGGYSHKWGRISLFFTL